MANSFCSAPIRYIFRRRPGSVSGSGFSPRRSSLAWSVLAMERIIIRRFYASPIIAMLGTYAIGLVIRETVRGLLGGHYQVHCAADRGLILIGGINFSIWRTIIIGATLVVLFASWWMLARTPGRAAHSRRTGKSDAGAGMRDFDFAALRADVCVRFRVGRVGGGSDRATVSAIGRHRHPVPGAGLFVRDAGRRWHVPGTGCWGRARWA